MNPDIDSDHRAPNSWPLLVAGFVAIGVAAVLSFALVYRYLSDRPIDLEPHTRYLSDITFDLLVNNRVPPENIVRGDTEYVRSDTAVWRHETFIVDLPAVISAEGLERVLRRDMAQRRVYVKAGGEGERIRRLVFSFSGQDFATVELRGGRVTASGPRDLVEPTQRLARSLRDALVRAMPEDAAVEMRIPERRQSDLANWSFARIAISWPDETPKPDLTSIVRAAEGSESLSVQPLSARTGRAGISVAYDGFECVEIYFDGEPVSGPPDIELPRLMSPTMFNEPELFTEELPDFDGPAFQPGTPDTHSDVVLDSTGLDSALLGPGDNGRPIGDPSRPIVAIIVDDGGNNHQVDDGFLELDPGLTFAILPFTPNAARLATQAAALGFEVMLHMPMESSNSRVTHPGMVRIAMDGSEIAAKTREALESVPGVRGVNNHTGSRFTETEPALRSVFDVLAEQDLYFVDSRTSALSVAPQLAGAMEIPVAIRDVFLDNEADLDYIAQRFDELMDKARKRGYAIGICHFRPVTLQAMRDLLPRLQSEGIELVHASELVR